ncbi:MAG TPA: hypothetical protein DDW52_16075 [Planctomycetaceae bacterium]|nr:hypothetical protein [Planctomycetaceae bacterium]
MSSATSLEQDRKAPPTALPYPPSANNSAAPAAQELEENRGVADSASALGESTKNQASSVQSGVRKRRESASKTSDQPVRQSTKRWKLGSRTCGVGIDVGSYLTKVVYYDPTQSPKYNWATIPTCAGTHRSETAGSGMDLLTAEQLGSSDVDPTEAISDTPNSSLGPDGETSETPRRRHSDGDLDFSRWSQKQFERLSEAIVNAAGKIRRGNVRIAMSMQACELRSIPVYPQEKLSTAEILDRLHTVIDDKRPQSLALLDRQIDSNRQKILSIPAELTDGLAVALDQSGMTPKSIEGLPWSLARLTTGSDRIETIVDWGVSSPTLVCVHNGLILYVRRLRSGGLLEMVESLIKTYDLGLSDAFRWLQNATRHGQSENPIHEGVREGVQTVSRRLATEVDAALEYVRWKNSGTEIGPIGLVGGGAELELAVQTLKQSLEYEVEIPNAAEIPPSLTVAASLARAE